MGDPLEDQLAVLSVVVALPVVEDVALSRGDFHTLHIATVQASLQAIAFLADGVLEVLADLRFPVVCRRAGQYVNIVYSAGR